MAARLSEINFNKAAVRKIIHVPLLPTRSYPSPYSRVNLTPKYDDAQGASNCLLPSRLCPNPTVGRITSRGTFFLLENLVIVSDSCKYIIGILRISKGFVVELVELC